MNIQTRPWNGLNMLEEGQHPREIPDLTWDVTTEDIYQVIDNMPVAIPGNRLLVRKDNRQPLSVIGKQYTPYSNNEMWDVIDNYCNITGGKIDAAGVMNNSFIWCSVKHGDYEIINNDPITSYEMFINPFVPGKAFSMINSDIRAVCGNMLNYILSQSKSYIGIRHTRLIDTHVKVAMDAAADSKRNRNLQVELMQHLASKQINDTDIDQFIEGVMPSKSEKVSPILQRRRDTLYGLIYNGLGADINGVQGTAYGLLQAGFEFADHHIETRSESKLFSSLYRYIGRVKQNVTQQALAIAA